MPGDPPGARQFDVDEARTRVGWVVADPGRDTDLVARGEHHPDQRVALDAPVGDLRGARADVAVLGRGDGGDLGQDAGEPTLGWLGSAQRGADVVKLFRQPVQMPRQDVVR